MFYKHHSSFTVVNIMRKKSIKTDSALHHMVQFFILKAVNHVDIRLDFQFSRNSSQTINCMAS